MKDYILVGKFENGHSKLPCTGPIIKGVQPRVKEKILELISEETKNGKTSIQIRFVGKGN